MSGRTAGDAVDTLLLAKHIASLILPPGGIIILMLAGLVLWRRRPRLGAGLVTAGLALLYFLSTAPGVILLMKPLERSAVLTPEAIEAFSPQAIVVLGGGRRMYAPEYGRPTVATPSLERVRYGAWLQRETRLPIAVTGGVVSGTGPPEADVMAQALRLELGAEVRWLETRSRNTEQNAVFSRALLARDGIGRIALVTHAAHMPRAAEMFRGQGFEVLEAPTAFTTGAEGPLQWRDWIPSTGALSVSWFALHEHLGRAWFRLRGWLGFTGSGPD